MEALDKEHLKRLVQEHINLYGLECDDVFSTFHDSPLGYLGVLKHEYELPEHFQCAARFEEIRSLCEGLNMEGWSAARYIYQQLCHHQPMRTLRIEGFEFD